MGVQFVGAPTSRADIFLRCLTPQLMHQVTQFVVPLPLYKLSGEIKLFLNCFSIKELGLSSDAYLGLLSNRVVNISQVDAHSRSLLNSLSSRQLKRFDELIEPLIMDRSVVKIHQVQHLEVAVLARLAR